MTNANNHITEILIEKYVHIRNINNSMRTIYPKSLGEPLKDQETDALDQLTEHLTFHYNAELSNATVKTIQQVADSFTEHLTYTKEVLTLTLIKLEKNSEYESQEKPC